MSEQHPQFDAALDAVDRGDLVTLSSLLARHPDLVHARAASDEPPYDGYFWRATLLHNVAGNPVRGELPDNAVEIARALLDAGAEVDAPCGGGPSQPDTGGTTLGLVASGAQAYVQGLTEPLIDCLLDAGAEMDADGSGGCMWMALYHTVENRGQRDVAEILYDRGHPVDLCFAAGLGKLELVEGYSRDDGTLAPEADRFYYHHRSSGPEASEREILHDAFLFACVNGRRETAEFLMTKGADVNTERPWGPHVVTPLHGAAWAGWRYMAEFLVENGADTQVRDPSYQATPVGWAAYCRRQDIVDYFLEDDSRLDFLDALEWGRSERFAELLGDGDPNQAIGAHGRGVLLRTAAAAGHLGIVETLLERGADLHLANPDGKTALDLAIERGHEAVAELLADPARGC